MLHSLFRSDINFKRKINRGRDSGGVAFYISEDIATTFEPLISFSDGVIEMLCIYSKHEHLLLAVLYRQPDDNAHGFSSSSTQYTSAINLLTNTINTMLEEKPDIIIGGDFNLPHANWNQVPNNSNTQIQRNNTGEQKKMILTTKTLQSDLNLSQMVLNSTQKHGIY